MGPRLLPDGVDYLDSLATGYTSILKSVTAGSRH